MSTPSLGKPASSTGFGTRPIKPTSPPDQMVCPKAYFKVISRTTRSKKIPVIKDETL
jgi:hypothetical protein